VEVVPILVVAVIGAAVWYLYHRHQEAQRERMRAVAARHGLMVDVNPKKPPPLDFDLFGNGSSKKVSGQMWRAGEQDSVFQYQYTVKSGQSSTTYEFSAALVALPFVAPHLVISTETWWTRAKRVVGMRDVEVESPEFNERYHVNCRDERFAITLLDPPMIAWMLSPHSGRGTITFEFGGSWMLCHGDQVDIERLPDLLAWAQSVRHQLPAVLTDLYGAR
jgi:hypothetical protein